VLQYLGSRSSWSARLQLHSRVRRARVVDANVHSNGPGPKSARRRARSSKLVVNCSTPVAPGLRLIPQCAPICTGPPSKYRILMTRWHNSSPNPYLRALRRSIVGRVGLGSVYWVSLARGSGHSRRWRLGLINPFRRSHIYAVMGGMMVVSGDVAIKGSSVRGSWVIRADPPWTKRPSPSVLGRVPVC
jgi:hypothetical protein